MKKLLAGVLLLVAVSAFAQFGPVNANSIFILDRVNTNIVKIAVNTTTNQGNPLLEFDNEAGVAFQVGSQGALFAPMGATLAGAVVNNGIRGTPTNAALVACVGGWGYTNVGPRTLFTMLNVSFTGVGSATAAVSGSMDVLLTNAASAVVTSNIFDFTTNATKQTGCINFILSSNDVVVVHTNRNGGVAGAYSINSSVTPQ